MWPFRTHKALPSNTSGSDSISAIAAAVSVDPPSAVPGTTKQELVPSRASQVKASEAHSIDVKAEAIKSVISSGEFIEGNMRFQHGVKIDGHIKGDVYFGINDGLFVLNQCGVVEGNIFGPRAIIVGEVFGNIVVSGKLIILPRARIHGDIAAGALQIMEGAAINGRITTAQGQGQVVAEADATRESCANEDVASPPDSSESSSDRLVFARPENLQPSSSWSGNLAALPGQSNLYQFVSSPQLHRG